jgi:putative sterol carrier protein
MGFPSAEWAERFRAALNENAGYREAAQAWEGDVMFLVWSPDRAVPAPGIHLDLAHGSCTAATFLPDARETSSEFVYSATAENWARLLRRELDPVRSTLDGTFKVRGNVAKAMRYMRAAKELIGTAATVGP